MKKYQTLIFTSDIFPTITYLPQSLKIIHSIFYFINWNYCFPIVSPIIELFTSPSKSWLTVLRVLWCKTFSDFLLVIKTYYGLEISSISFTSFLNNLKESNIEILIVYCLIRPRDKICHIAQTWQACRGS